jgi:hypothetical protein
MKAKWWIPAAAGLALLLTIAGCGPDVQVGSAMAVPDMAPLGYQRVTIAEAGLELDVPAGWTRLEPDWAWVPPEPGERYVGVTWADLHPPAEPEALLLPRHAQILDAVQVDLAWGSGRWMTVEVYAPVTSQGSEEASQVLTVETHVLIVTDWQPRRAFDFYGVAPDAVSLSTLEQVLDIMLGTVEPSTAPAPALENAGESRDPGSQAEAR